MKIDRAKAAGRLIPLVYMDQCQDFSCERNGFFGFSLFNGLD